MTQQTTLQLQTKRGFYRLDNDINQWLAQQMIDIGLVNVFIQHTSASLVITENADPDVKRDLEMIMQRLAPDGDSAYLHVDEGPDDMPAHIRSVLTQTSISLPVQSGRLALGTWQSLYLWEHRMSPCQRRVIVTLRWWIR